MTPYADAGGDSGVAGYTADDSSITVHFRQGRWRNYRYTDASAGSANVSKMIELALAGQGLNEFINRARPGFAEKW